MTAKSKQVKRKRARGELADCMLEGELLSLADGKVEAESLWNRPRKEKLSLRVDAEVVDWFKSKGLGYQTRINRTLRRVMIEEKRRPG